MYLCYQKKKKRFLRYAQTKNLFHATEKKDRKLNKVKKKKREKREEKLCVIPLYRSCKYIRQEIQKKNSKEEIQEQFRQIAC